MKKLLLTIVKYILAFSIAIILLWWSLHNLTQQDKVDIKNALFQANYLILIPVCILLFVSHILRALRWKQLIRALNHHPPISYLICGVLLGYAANLFIPRAGEIARCTAISKQTHIPAEKLVGTIVAERAFDFICLILITAATVIIDYTYIKAYAIEISNAIQSGLQQGGSARWVTLSIIITFIAIIIWLVYKFRTHKWAAFLNRMGKGLWQGLISIKKVDNKPLFFLSTAGIWICYILCTWMSCLALTATNNLGIDTALAMLVFGTFGIIVAPGGLGAYPIAIQKVLLLYGINGSIGLACGWLSWLTQFFFTLIAGTIAYIALKFLKPHEESELHS